MKSWNKAAIGLLVASAMAIGTGVAASADSVSTPADSSSTSSQVSQSSDGASAEPSNSAEPNTDLKVPESPLVSTSTQPQAGKISAPEKTENETKQAQENSGEKAQQKSQTSSLTRSQQQPQAQDDPDSSIKAQGDWGGNEDGTEKVHWFVQETAPNKEVLHIGPGVIGAEDGSPLYFTYTNPAVKDDVVRIVFDDAPNTHVAKTSFLYGFNGFPNVTSIDNVGDLDFSRLQGQTGKFSLRNVFNGFTHLKTLDLTGWGTGRTAPGAGLPGVKTSSKWKTDLSIRMDDLFTRDYALTTITGLDDWDTSAVYNMAGMFQIDYYGHGQLSDVGDLSRWDVSNVTETDHMFEGNTKLTSLGDLSDWNLGKDTNAGWMFQNTAISSFGNVSNWGMGSMTNMVGIFEGMANLTALPGIKNWDMRKNRLFQEMVSGCHSLTSLDLTGWQTDSNVGMYGMFYDAPALKEIKGLENLNVSKVKNMSDLFHDDNALTSLDLSGWDTRQVTYHENVFPLSLNEIKLGSNTQLTTSFFSYDEPSSAGATEDNGYTGRWTKDDNTWTSDASDDNHALAAWTQDSGFASGTYVWQEFAEVSFRKNAPKHAKISGSPVTIRKVGAKAADIKIEVPRLMFHAKGYKFLGWNSGKQGGQVSFKKGDTVTNFNRGENLRLWAQWQSRGVPSTPIRPAAMRYTIHYEANAPQGLTATGSVPDDVFTVNPAPGVDLLHYPHQVTKKVYKVEGYKFLTWSTREDMHGGRYDGGSEIRVAPGTTTLYAVWAQDTDTTGISTPTTPTTPTHPTSPTNPKNPETPTEPTTPTSPTVPTAPKDSTSPTTPKIPTTLTQNQGPQGIANNGGGNAVAPRSAIAPLAALPVAAPAFAPAQRVGGNAVVAAPVAGSDGVVSAPQQQRQRPKCVPEDVYQKMKSGKRGSQPVYWIEPDGSAYVQNSAWSLSDYNGLPQCSIEASAPTSGVRMSFNFWWLLVFLIPLFMLVFAYRNGGYVLARHRNLDSADIRK